MNKLMAFIVFAMASTAAFCAAPTRGLVAYYPFDGNAKDKSGNHNHGEMHGTRPTADRKGRLDSAMLFGEGNYISVPSSPSLNSPKDQITIAAWVRVNERNRNRFTPIVCKGRCKQYQFIMDGGDLILKSPSMGMNIRSGFAFLRGQWQHFAISFDASLVRAYINGSFVGASMVSGNFPPSDEDLYIGEDCHSGDDCLRGAMDELRIYNRALTDDEIKAVYEADPPTKTTKTEIKGWHVTTFDRTVRSIGDAEATVQSNLGMIAQGDYPVLAFTNNGSAPHQEQHYDFPGKNGCLVMRANGTIHIPSAGMWTFGIHCDDGAKVRIKGKDFVDVIVAGCAWNQRFPINIPAAGDYEIEVTFFDFMKGCVFMFSAAKGNWATFDESAFRLVGDPECEIKLVEEKTSKADEPYFNASASREEDAECPMCHGEKMIWARCKKCNGKGMVVKKRTLSGGGTVKEYFKCPACSSASTPPRGKGRGKVRRVCPACNGEGSMDGE